MKSSKQRKFLGAIGFNTKSPSKKEYDIIKAKHTNDFDEFHHHNPRTGIKEHVKLEDMKKFNNKKFALIGTSPSDKKKISKIIHHQ